ncbi:hypothetical protein C1N50_08565 [Vibrio campbellii]|nr:hypothetical protein C1N50_08565 [Vibrio campbellii]
MLHSLILREVYFPLAVKFQILLHMLTVLMIVTILSMTMVRLLVFPDLPLVLLAIVFWGRIYMEILFIPRVVSPISTTVR